MRAYLAILQFSVLCAGVATAQVINPLGLPPRYPVFQIPLGGNWVDFEIKATTNNFADGEKVLWLDSLCGVSAVFASSDVAAYTADIFWMPQSTVPEQRTLLAMSASSADSFSTVTGATGDPALAPPEALVQLRPATRATADISAWFKPTNPNLLFIYCRKTLVGTELNSFGTRLWHPIRPLEWRTVPLSVP